MTEYTPTWTEVETAYVLSRLAVSDGNEDARAEEIHRWLAEHDRQVAERAWDEAAQALAWCIDNGPVESAATHVAQNNPYRKEATGD